MLLLHYTGMRTGAAALARLTDPVSEVSAHYVVEENGEIIQLVPEARRAWHAGRGSWQGREDVNSRAIGIEIVNPAMSMATDHFRNGRSMRSSNCAKIVAIAGRSCHNWSWRIPI